MSFVGQFLPLLFGAGSIVGGSSFIFPELFGADSNVIMQVSGSSVNSENKEWIMFGGGSSGEGIFVKSKGTYSTKGFGSSKFYGPARVGSLDSQKVTLAGDDKTIMIVSGEKGVIILRGQRYFNKEKGGKVSKEIQDLNSQIWNTGNSSLLKDQEKDYYCKGRTDKWKELWGNKEAQKIGYVKQKKAEGPLGIINLIDQNKLTQKTFFTPCRGTDIFYPEKLSFFGKSENGDTAKIEVAVKSDKTKLGYQFNLGTIEAVLYGRNKDLKITEQGIEDGIGNRIKWGSGFFPEVKLIPVS